MESIIANIVVILILALVLGLAIGYIVKKKKSGAHCIGCPSSGSCSKCTCNEKK